MSAATENANTMAPGTNTPASSGLRHNVYRSKYVVAAASVIGGLLVWEIVSRFFIANALFLAAPSQVAMAIYRLAATGELGQHIVISAAEFALGLRAGPLPAELFVANATGRFTDTAQRFAYNTTNGRLFFDAQGDAPGSSRLLIAHLDARRGRSRRRRLTMAARGVTPPIFRTHPLRWPDFSARVRARSSRSPASPSRGRFATGVTTSDLQAPVITYQRLM